MVRKNFFVLLLLVTILLQTLDKFGLVLYYQEHKAYIIDFFCINKEEPLKMCSGKCYLVSEFEKQDRNDEHNLLDHLQNSTINYIIEDFKYESIFVPAFLVPSVFNYRGLLSQCFFMEIFHPPQ